jgi:uncharacterized membrane protein YbhN (UPF0104 family)
MKLKSFLKIVAVTISISLLVFIFKFWDISFVETVKRLNMQIVIIGFMLFGIMIIFRTLRIADLLSIHHKKIRFQYLFYVQNFSNLVSLFTPGKSGEVIKILMLRKKYKISIKELGSIFVIEKTMDFSVYAVGTILAVVMLGAHLSNRVNIPGILWVFIVIIILFTAIFFSYYTKTREYRVGHIGRIIGYTLLSFVSIFTTVFISFYSFGIASLRKVFIMNMIATMIGLLSFLPGSRGAAELSTMGIGTTVFNFRPEALAASLVQIIIIIYAGNLLTLLISWLFIRKRRKND